MSKSRLLLVVTLLLIVFSVLFFTGYLPKFELVGPVTWYFRNDLTLSTVATNSKTNVSAVRPSSDNVTFCVEFKAGNRLLLDREIIELPPQYGIGRYVHISFNNSTYPNEDIKIILYFKDLSGKRFLQVQFNSSILNANSFSVDGQLGYEIDSHWDYSRVAETVYIYYGDNSHYITGISYFKVPPPPTASFSYNPINPSIADNIIFDASSSTGTNITSYTWNFYMPNGTLYKSIIESDPYINMNLPVEGSWTVKLTLADIYGQTGTTSKTVSVSAYPLSVDFSWFPSNPYDYDTVTFTASIEAKYGVKSITWNFGDGNIGTVNPIDHIYVKSGMFKVSVTVIDNNNIQVSVTKEITVTAYTFSVDFTYTPEFPQEFDSITFTATCTSKYNIKNVYWTFGDSSSDSGNPIIHTYTKSNTYIVTVNVTDINGKYATSTKQVTVSAYSISVDFSYNPSSPVEGDNITFTATYSSKYSIINISWNFGDGSYDSKNPTHHSYSNGGVYSVTVTIIDSNNKHASLTKQVNVLYVVKFVETGLPSGISWKVVFNNVEKTSTENIITYTSNSGTFSYAVQSLDVKYVSNPYTGTITVPNTKTLTITFTRQPLTDIEITGPSSLPENTIGNYTLKPEIQNVVQPNYPIQINIVKDGVQIDTMQVYSDGSGIVIFSYSFTTGGTYSLDFYDADLNVFVKSFTLTVKASLTIVSETQLIQTYDLSGEVDFNAVFRVKAGNSYTSDFNIVNLTLIDEKTGNSIPYESYKEDYSIYVKAYLFKYYGIADDRDIRLTLELSSNTYLGTSYSLTVKITKPTIVVYMTDSSGQLIKSFVTGTNTFYLKFEAKGLNVNPSDVNITVINPEGVKSSVSPYNIVPAGTNIVKVTYTFERTGTYVFVIELHGVVEMQPKTFTYSVNEPYNFFRYDNPFFVAVVIIAILVAYSLVKRKRNV